MSGDEQGEGEQQSEAFEAAIQTFLDTHHPIVNDDQCRCCGGGETVYLHLCTECCSSEAILGPFSNETGFALHRQSCYWFSPEELESELKKFVTLDDPRPPNGTALEPVCFSCEKKDPTFTNYFEICDDCWSRKKAEFEGAFDFIDVEAIADKVDRQMAFRPSVDCERHLTAEERAANEEEGGDDDEQRNPWENALLEEIRRPIAHSRKIIFIRGPPGVNKSKFQHGLADVLGIDDKLVVLLTPNSHRHALVPLSKKVEGVQASAKSPLSLSRWPCVDTRQWLSAVQR